MKWGLFSILMVLGILYTPIQTSAQSVGVSNAAITPDASSMFEVRATNKGVLITRVALTATNAAGPIASPATSLLVYNTATAGSGTATGVYPGYYYNAGTPAAPNWKRMATGTGSGDAWLTTGNFGTTPANNWLGTNDAQDFVIRSNNTERMRVVSGGNVIVNTNTPIDVTDALEVVVSPTFTTGLGAYGNGGYPIYSEQLNGADDAITAINSAATGAGNGNGVFGVSYQTGGAGVFGYGSMNTRGVMGLTINATYAGVQGQNGHGDGDGVYGINNAATGAGVGAGVYGYTEQTGGAGVVGSGNTTTRGVIGLNSNATYAAVHAQNGNAGGDALYAGNSAANGAGTGSAIYASSNQTGGATIIADMQSLSYYSGAVISAVNDWNNAAARGIIADVSHRDAIAVYGYNTAASSTGTGNGVYGTITQSAGFGVNANNDHTSGTGLMAVGNNETGTFLTSGTGGAFTADDGLFAIGVDASGTGVIGVGNDNALISILSDGSGGAFTGDYTGVYGVATERPSAVGDISAGGYFVNNYSGDFAYVGAYERTTLFGYTSFKIVGTGTVSTIVERKDGSEATMFAPEAPEILFQDYGTGQLVNGKAHIDLDPILTNNIFVNDEHPLKVFIQLEGDCNGVYVTNKTSTGFDVIELQGGNSNVPFSWSLVANRKDRIKENGQMVSKHVGVRFPDAPKQMKSKSKESQKAPEVDLPKEQELKNESQNIEIDKKLNPVKKPNVSTKSVSIQN